MPVYTILANPSAEGGELTLHGVTLQTGEITFNSVCELADFVNNARYVGGTLPPEGKPFRFYESKSTRYTLDGWAREAALQGCPFTRDDLYVEVPSENQLKDGDPKNVDSPEKQGAPQQPSGTNQAIASGKPGGTGTEEQQQYGPLQSEVEKRPHDAPTSSETSNQPSQAGDPVDLFRGAFTIIENDISVPGTPLALVRTYRSGQAFPGPFAWNWDHNHNIYLRELQPAESSATGDVARWTGALREDIFRNNGAGFDPPRGVFQILEQLPPSDPNGEYRIRDVGGVIMYFQRPVAWSDSYRIPLARIIDRFGHTLEYSYDSENRLDRVTYKPVDDSGATASAPYHYLEFGYGNCGLLESVTDSLGRAITYWHDPDIQHLLGVVMPPAQAGAEPMTRRFHYGGLHEPEILRHAILRVEDAAGRVYVENEYDDDPSSWSFGHLLVQIHGGYPYQFQYTPLEWVPPNDNHLNIPAQRTEVIDPDGGLTTYTFNFRGDILDRRTRLAEDGSYRITAVEFDYDTQGNRTRSQVLRDFDEATGGIIVYAWGTGERITYHPDHADPRMRGMVQQVELLDGGVPDLTTWRATYEPNLQLVLTEQGTPGDGFTAAQVTTTYHYSLDGLGRLESVVHPDVLLPGGTTQTAQTRYETDLRGRTTAVTTAEGIRHEFEYDNGSGLTNGRLLRRIVDAAGIAAVERYTYDANGYLASTIDASGAERTQTNDIFGRMVEAATAEIAGARAVTRIGYDPDGLIVRVERPCGAYADGVIQGESIVDLIERNVLGHVTGTLIGANTGKPRRTHRTVDFRGLATASVDPLGAVSRWRYDERGLLLEHTVERDGAKSASRYSYARDGRPAQQIEGVARDQVAETIYGPYGRPARVHRLHRAPNGTTTPNGATVRYYYSDRGLVERTELRAYPGLDANQLLARTELAYDARGRLVSRTERPFSDADPFDEITTPRLTTTFTWDRDDRLAIETDHRDGTHASEYDGLGRAIRNTDPLGNTQEYAYDIAARTVTITRGDLPPGGGSPDMRSWVRTYDARGRVISVADPDGAASTYEYDDRDLLTAAVERDGTTRTEYSYGLLNEMLSRTLDPSGLNLVHTQAYDLAGRMTAYTDPSGQTTTYEYDGIGRLLGTRMPGDPAPRTHAYGPDGRLARTVMPGGITLDYGYDDAGRLASLNARNLPAGVAAIPGHLYTYDLLGRMTGASAGSAVVARTYDSLGRQLTETADGDTLQALYDDAAGAVTRIFPDGRQETLSTNLNGVVTRIERTAAGTLGAGAAVLAEFTPYGPAASGTASLLGGLSETVEYDARLRANAIRLESGGTAIEEAIYRHDTRDRRRVELLTRGTVQSRLYDFDARSRLARSREEGAAITGLGTGGTQAENDADIAAVESAMTAPGTLRWLYTPAPGGRADERLAEEETPSGGTPATTAYTYAAGHRLASAGAESVTHYPDGARKDDGAARYTVDALGRIVRAENLPGTAVPLELRYDALGRVSGITQNGGTERRMGYFGAALWQEKEAGTVVRQFTHHPLRPGTLAMHVSGETYLTHHDARCNLLAVTDSSGVVAERFRYQPFGAPAPAASSTGVEPRFGGLRWLNDAGLYLAGSRLMDPRHGAWLSPDPLGYADSANLYSYAAGNPVDRIDPSGLAAQKGSTGGASDGSGTGSGAGGPIGVPAPGAQPGGTSIPSVLYGPGSGEGVGGPQWLNGIASALRDMSNSVRRAFSDLMDGTLGQLGNVGQFIGG
ncbi:MAG TPA: RHS repeat-associated core domain-containing protein, partial [Candidatus Kapabacteria bacterium]|nr:RHS repeat-associated core domain-containing protein [Candidatus Kapabacteria bacterium]